MKGARYPGKRKGIHFVRDCKADETGSPKLSGPALETSLSAMEKGFIDLGEAIESILQTFQFRPFRFIKV